MGLGKRANQVRLEALGRQEGRQAGVGHDAGPLLERPSLSSSCCTGYRVALGWFFFRIHSAASKHGSSCTAGQLVIILP
jgi:hypothetical protein